MTLGAGGRRDIRARQCPLQGFAFSLSHPYGFLNSVSFCALSLWAVVPSSVQGSLFLQRVAQPS